MQVNLEPTVERQRDTISRYAGSAHSCSRAPSFAWRPGLSPAHSCTSIGAIRRKPAVLTGRRSQEWSITELFRTQYEAVLKRCRAPCPLPGARSRSRAVVQGGGNKSAFAIRRQRNAGRVLVFPVPQFAGDLLVARIQSLAVIRDRCTPGCRRRGRGAS